MNIFPAPSGMPGSATSWKDVIASRRSGLIQQPAFFYPMSARSKLARIKLVKINPLPLPPSLAEAFEAIEQLDSRHPEPRGTSYGAIRTAEARDVARRMTQDGR